jgi:hypothetical protein
MFLTLILRPYTKAIRKVTSGELSTKQAMRKIVYKKNTYVFKLLLNIVPAGIEACELNHVLICSINSSLLLKLCRHNQIFRQVNRW